MPKSILKKDSEQKNHRTTSSLTFYEFVEVETISNHGYQASIEALLEKANEIQIPEDLVTNHNVEFSDNNSESISETQSDHSEEITNDSEQSSGVFCFGDRPPVVKIERRKSDHYREFNEFSDIESLVSEVQC